jgi:hypothetical protein
MKQLTTLTGTALLLTGLLLTGCATQHKNSVFYKDGKFDSDKGKQAYFDLMKKHGAPIYDIYKSDPKFLWAIDFGTGNFTQFGMGGVFWFNEKAESYFAHEIFLLPYQCIAEHGHHETDMPAKMESWIVRYGSVYAFSEDGEPNLDKYPELVAKLPKEITQYLKSCHVKQFVADGRPYKLPYKKVWHFMMGGPDGAIVSEAGTYHDNNGLRFRNPGVKF